VQPQKGRTFPPAQRVCHNGALTSQLLMGEPYASYDASSY